MIGDNSATWKYIFLFSYPQDGLFIFRQGLKNDHEIDLMIVHAQPNITLKMHCKQEQPVSNHFYT